MDILTSQGEISPPDLAEIEAMTQGELVALVIATNRGWYQLLERLEQAHKLDLTKASEAYSTQLVEATRQFEKRLAEELETLREKEKEHVEKIRSAYSLLEVMFKNGRTTSAENAQRLKDVKELLEKISAATLAK